MCRRSWLRAVPLAVLTALAILVPAAAWAAPQPPPEPTSTTPAAALPPGAVPPADRARVLPPDWRTSADLAWTTTGDASGFHVLVARATTGYQWRTVATLVERGFDADRWIGNACLTASGNRLVVVYAPRTFTNKVDLFDRGGFTAVVDLATGRVTKLPIQSTLAYFNPGCGAGERAVVTQLGGEQDERTSRNRSRVTEVDASAAKLGRPIEVAAEVTSAVPTTAGIVAAGGAGLLRVAPDGRLTRLADTEGTAFHVRADGGDGVVFLDRTGQQARARRLAPDGGVRTLATGAVGQLGLAPGTRGRVFLTGRPSSVASLPAEVTRIAADARAEVSTLGRVAINRLSAIKAGDGGDPAAARPVRIEATMVGTGEAVAFGVQPSTGDQPTGFAAGTTNSGEAVHPALAQRSTRPGWSPGSPTNPVDTDAWCSVRRNEPNNQAMQPKPRQVEWAVDQAITNTPYAAREANWKNLGMPAYSPLDYFPRIVLLGGGRVPAQIMLGILAQESNLWQASGIAVPGVTANPLIGNFYGRPIYDGTETNDWDIHWDKADCGYGVAQVTDGMRAEGFEKPNERALDYDQQRAVALDFAANVAAGVRILQSKWNQTRGGGLVIGNGDPARLENWFFAIWAYNSGFYPDTGGGQPWGVGWANNPVNPKYPADRDPFLEFTYDDARHPQDWPYPEKVLGFAGNPPDLLEAPDTYVSAYRPAWWTSDANKAAVKPPTDLFCKASNQCDTNLRIKPNAPDVANEPAGPCAHQNLAGQYDLRCWWNQPTTWKNPDQMGYELLRFDPGYAYQADATSYAPRCSPNLGLPANTLVIDDVADNVPSVRPNCPRGFTNSGSLTWQFGADNNTYPAKVDFHQIGGGLAGHFWFAHTRLDTSANAKMHVTGTWRLNQSLVNTWARVLVHMPDQGAHTRQALYKINLGSNDIKERYLPQRTREHRWVSLGAFKFTGTPSVELSTKTRDGTGEEDVAWDAIAFQKLPGKPRHQVVALGDSYTSGEGASSTDGADYYRESDYKVLEFTPDGDVTKAKNVCHRSRNAWPRQGKLSDDSKTIGQRADEFDFKLDFHFGACAWAETEWMLPYHSVPGTPVNAFGEHGRDNWGEVPQLDSGFLDDNTTLVVFSIGGNDARFSPVFEQCIYGTVRVCQNSTLDGDTKNMADAEHELIQGKVKDSIKIVIDEVHKKAPNAKILLMGYPRLLEALGSCILGIGTEEAPWLNQMADEIAGMMDAAVNEMRAAPKNIPVWFANPISAFAGKAICGNPESVHGIVTQAAKGEGGYWPDWLPVDWNSFGVSQQSFHPKTSGAAIYGQVFTNAAQSQLGL
ncbi:SGNH/GDSL hydrolase family protein [Asanoa sp. WMMD1127]|uniref:SGNH/GDSL hydrolase family protein n=1 Tax=Asanoa sp. WMMD1127 TaxID=3016107 RepID=UPI002417C77B|nr:SGNH/GDSL hydrolase family protein [Asanoa sp. WMMD1127]MDG4820679.1 SGNH/GDSL hydrolase family protein [Asanoa sp. WMMD1127]